MKEEQKQPVTVGVALLATRLVAWNVLASLVLAGFMWWGWGHRQAYAVLFASAIVVVNTLILGNRLAVLPGDAGRARVHLLGGVVMRFLIAIAALWLAIAYLRLPIAGLVLGFLIAHFVSLAYMLRERKKEMTGGG